MKENDISYFVRGACFRIYNSLGPGMLESVYETALAYELNKAGFEVEVQKCIPVTYEDVNMEAGFRLDILVNNMVIIEIKSVEKIAEIHFKQLLTYLKLTNLKLGLLINFNTVNISKSIYRVVNHLEE